MSERFSVGVDIGGTNIKLGLVDESGVAVRRARFDTLAAGGPDDVLRRTADGINALVDGFDGPVLGVGIGVPGVINTRGEISHPPNLPGWEVVPVAERLLPHLALDVPIVVENDANVAAFAESRVGAGRDLTSFLFVTLGTGIGGCIIVDREIWRGGGGGAGEVGHVSIDPNGPLCACGARGCIETYIGQRHLRALALERLPRYPDSSLHAVVADGTTLSARLIMAAADGGDPLARELFAEVGWLLGVALASVLNLCDLTTVLVGGGISHAGDHLLEPARAALRLRALRSIAPRTEIRLARLGNDAGFIGAAMLGFERSAAMA